MSEGFKGWDVVARSLRQLAHDFDHDRASPAAAGWTLNEGQCRSLEAIAQRLPQHGLVVADEVGMGKTRIAVALARAVVEAGGRVAVLVPPGLGFQWQDELLHGGLHCRPLLRSLWQFLTTLGPAAGAVSADYEPWSDQPVVLLSHVLINWKLGGTSRAWRWALLPQVHALWHQQRRGCVPYGYRQRDKNKLDDVDVMRVAQAIVADAARQLQGSAAAVLDELIDALRWGDTLEAGAYARSGQLRPWLERVVGLGLGFFDLVVIDEAHKNRGEESGLSRLLDDVVLIRQDGGCNHSGRRLALTATPVELDAAQWRNALERIGVDSTQVTAAIEAYTQAVKSVREKPTQPDARSGYVRAAADFQQALSPYLLRRDKRESPSVQRFSRYCGLPVHAYREEKEIRIRTADLDPRWRQALCAAEALSVVGPAEDGPSAQRLRLTIGNGHGLNAVLDECTRDEVQDRQQIQHDASLVGADAEPVREPGGVATKQSQRARWWMETLKSALRDGSASLFDHPGILAAVRAIEAEHAQCEKVLVFGRFTLPMRALVELLNAREMLRCLATGRPWSQASVHDDEWPAVQVAHRQLALEGVADRQVLDAQLAHQYRALENHRQRVRDQLGARLEAGMHGLPARSRARALLQAFLRDRLGLPALAKALSEMLGPDALQESPQAWVVAFAELVEASCDRGEGDADGDGELDDQEAAELWQLLAQRLHEEHDRPQGGFARLMHGETSPQTRRLLQMAFNRQHAYPRVLVAQSLVGREGLNLHRACRTVVLLHPEWNPGVVEQQIGRVDRVGSRWERLLDEAIATGVAPGQVPRIQVRPVVFEGTYDEFNWSVLRQRWDELRAQLHGVVIPAAGHSHDEEVEQLIKEINAAAPNFSPLRAAP